MRLCCFAAIIRFVYISIGRRPRRNTGKTTHQLDEIHIQILSIGFDNLLHTHKISIYLQDQQFQASIWIVKILTKKKMGDDFNMKCRECNKNQAKFNVNKHCGLTCDCNENRKLTQILPSTITTMAATNTQNTIESLRCDDRMQAWKP